ncbi:glycoside hydrolase family 88 protein [Aspergillus affinis]|uniref:glycoside hydrolase family 88 protein n=1 Tax=Aspergillus affinis TaxID=1070780 RepID=UPI0022FEFED1|nr:Six-hairpin glycosidase [Aspergillus affinis]KAI9039692.1 Six-hairpin glycosidase [Aspergillus affinis]
MSLSHASPTEHSPKRVKAAHQHPNGITGTNGTKTFPSTTSTRLAKALFSDSAIAKIWRVAARAQGSSKPPVLYPEYTGSNGSTYVYRTLDFWTSGFFPGSLYLILERLTRYQRTSIYRSSSPSDDEDNESKILPHHLQLSYLCRWWTANLHQNALKRDTHDLGFMIAPWAMKAWDLHHDAEAYNSLVLAAHSLASRFNATTRCIRSWDVCITNRYSYTDVSTDFLVIIDSMLNLDLLFWTAHETNNAELYDIAVAHAHTSRRHHVREDNSTAHVANFDAQTGECKARFTNQGYSDESCWARGQAWGILGFAQTFRWTGQSVFLDTARALAEYFISHLPEDGVPYWDFMAPVTDESPRDTSAAIIAACGMLVLFKSLRDTSEGEYYLREALGIVDAAVGRFLNPPTLMFQMGRAPTQYEVYPEGCIAQGASDGFDVLSYVDQSGSRTRDTILDGATINNYEFAPRRWANHGLVYADYYFLLFGNMLQELGLVDMQGHINFPI